MPENLTHFSASGRAQMVDVSDKSVTQRSATASGIIRMQPTTLQRIRAGQVSKGNVLTVVDVAAVMAAKRTSELIPMCHSLPLSGVEIAFDFIETADAHGCLGLRVITTANCTGQTGVEMEALTAASVALLTVYDMCKAMDKGMRIETIQLEEKHGGKSGVWKRGESK